MSDKNLVEKNPIDRAQGFWQKKKQVIAGFIIAVIVVFGGWFGYQSWVVQPKEAKAEEAIFKAQQYFAQDSLQKALDGDGQYKGFLYIINNYSGTKTANLAEYYAGVSYLKLNDFEKAIKHLKAFHTDAKQVQLMAYGCLGDAYSETNKKEEAIDAYKKAASTFEKDEMNSAEYLFRAALLSETMGKNKEALELYKDLKSRFPHTEKGSQADKYIYRLNIEPNDLGAK